MRKLIAAGVIVLAAALAAGLTLSLSSGPAHHHQYHAPKIPPNYPAAWVHQPSS
jgi:hypothetical protein